MNEKEQPAQTEEDLKDSKPLHETHSGKKRICLLNLRLTQKYEHIWKVFFVVVLALGAYLFQKVYQFQTNPHFEPVRQGNLSQMIIYGLPFSVAYTLFDLLVHYLLDDACEQHYITEERYVEPEAKKKRSYTLVKWSYSCLYYLASSAWAYKILIDTQFMPTWLGGQGSPFSMAQNIPRVQDATFEMKVFYILQFGKHFSRFFAHIFIRPEGNFFEYCLHHGLSTFLIVFSYLTNQWLIGIFVLLVHDYSDFGLTIGRGYKDYRHARKRVIDVLYVHGFIVWIMGRIVLFISVCIVPSVYAGLNVSKTLTEFELSILFFPYMFMIFMMVSLEIMHIFWTYFIIETFVAVKISSKLAKHSYD